MTVHELSRLDARRIAVRAQRLDRPRPTELLDVVRQLTLLQIDPTAAIAPSADLVAWSRLGSWYSPAELDTALADRTLLELRVLRVDAIHRDVPFDRTMTAAVDGEIKDLAHWLQLDLTLPGE